MRKRHLFAACALLALVGLVAAGCGGGGGKKGYALSKADYASALSTICKNASSQLQSLGIDNTMATFKDKGDQAVKITEDTLNKAKALTPADEVKNAAQEFNDSVDHALSDFKDATSAAKDDDQTKFDEAISDAQSDGQKSEAAAGEIGANDCT